MISQQFSDWSIDWWFIYLSVGHSDKGLYKHKIAYLRESFKIIWEAKLNCPDVQDFMNSLRIPQR